MQEMVLLSNRNQTKDFIKHLMREPWRVDIGLKVFLSQLCKRVLLAKAKLHIDVILLKALACQSLIHSLPIILPITPEQSVPSH